MHKAIYAQRKKAEISPSLLPSRKILTDGSGPDLHIFPLQPEDVWLAIAKKFPVTVVGVFPTMAPIPGVHAVSPLYLRLDPATESARPVALFELEVNHGLSPLK